MTPEDVQEFNDLLTYMQETARRCQRGLIGSRTVFCALEDIFNEGQEILNRYREHQQVGQRTYEPGELLDIMHFHEWPSRHQVQLLRDLIELSELTGMESGYGSETIDSGIVKRASNMIKQLQSR